MSENQSPQEIASNHPEYTPAESAASDSSAPAPENVQRIASVVNVADEILVDGTVFPLATAQEVQVTQIGTDSPLYRVQVTIFAKAVEIAPA